MTGTNHLLTGAAIGAAIANPVALPVAFVSHFVLDLLPHYGNDSKARMRKVLATDAVTCATLLINLLAWRPEHWQLMLACGVLAALPDALWIPYELAERRNQPREYKKLAQFLHDIQWGERPWGLRIEVPFACIVAVAVAMLARAA